MRRAVLAIAGILVLFSGRDLRAGVFIVDFEGLPDLTPVASAYVGLGVTFSSGIVAVSGAFGGSLNEVDFPPVVPGQAVFLNEADTTTLTFAQPISTFSGFFTYGGPLTINLYNSLNSLLTTRTTAFLTNIGTGGDPGSSPNEFISAINVPDAVRVDILAPGVDFTLDNLSFTTSGSTAVPEPGSAGLLAILAAGAVFARFVFPRKWSQTVEEQS